MDFELSEEQRMFQDSVRRLAVQELTDGALARAQVPSFPFDIAKLFAANGLLGITIDPAAGGVGGTLMDAVLAIEQIALVCPKSADVVQAGNFGAIRTLAEYASVGQKQRFLPRLLAGESVIGLGMSEPDAGSAVTDLKTSARHDGGGFRISGGKVFTSHSAEADVFLVYVRFGPSIDNIGSVILERGMPGFSFGAPATYMNGEQWCALHFDDVFVPADNVLLGPGGFKKQIAGFNAERIGNAARAFALGYFAFNAARDYAQTRTQFGRALCEFQGIQWKFAEMKMQLDAAQLLLYRAAVKADRGLPSAMDTSVAKALCNSAGFNACNEAMQVLGGLGYCRESLVEYCFRKTRGWLIAGGSLEMMKNRIAEGIFERQFSQRLPRAARV